MKRLLVLASATLLLTACNPFNKKQKDDYAGIDGSDYVSGIPLGERAEGASFLGSNVSRNQFEPVQFGFDSYTVSSSEMYKVRAVADAMRSAGNTIIIAGFTDERGTEEYNRGLGEKRALAVREALSQAGIRANRIQTVSFGKEMPVDPSSNEAAWAKNRRAEFGIVK